MKKWMEEEAGLDLMNIKMAERDNLEEKKDELKNLLKSENPKVILCDEFKKLYSKNQKEITIMPSIVNWIIDFN